MLLQVIELHHQFPSTSPPACRSPQFGFLPFEDDIVRCVVAGKVVEDGTNTSEFPVVGVVDLQKVHDPPPTPAHSPLLWSTAVLRR